MKPLDLVKLDTVDGTIYSFLSVNIGMMADIDIESERFRRLGNARFTVEAIAKILSKLHEIFHFQFGMQVMLVENAL